jgi:nicotinamide mononucleotide (NMN) deamidase PncC
MCVTNCTGEPSMMLKTSLTYIEQYKQKLLNETTHEHPLEKHEATSLKFVVGLGPWG